MTKEPIEKEKSKKESEREGHTDQENEENVLKKFSDIIKDHVEPGTQKQEGSDTDEKESKLKTGKTKDFHESSKTESLEVKPAMEINSFSLF